MSKQNWYDLALGAALGLFAGAVNVCAMLLAMAIT